ncbi:ABC transporter ATP-binding protein [Pradoshia sp.]
MACVVSFQDVSKVFKGKTAVEKVSFTINEGETVAILGPNGAGKTTTIMMMLGLMQVSDGKIEIFGQEVADRKIRERIGVMLQEVSMIDALKVHEVLKLFQSYYQNPLSYDELVAITGLDSSRLKQMANKLSGGQKRRLNFALALAGNPDVLFIDEPTVGMDVSSRRLFWETVHRLKEKGKTIIFTTHYLPEADEIASRILLFAEGRIIADGSPQTIKANLTKKSLSFDRNDTIMIDVLKQDPVITSVKVRDNRVIIESNDIDDVLRRLMQTDMHIQNISVEQGKLEEAFELLTSSKEEQVQ